MISGELKETSVSESGTNLDVGGIKLLLHHLFKDGEGRLDGLF